MRKLTKYLLSDFFTTFFTAALLITFVMCIGAIYKAIDIMSRGLSPGLVGRYFLNNIPLTLSYSIPMSAMFSTLLLYGRLSSDSEISAMKSGGMSIWQISAPLILVSMVLSGVCLYNNSVVFPKTEYENRKLIKGLGVEDPIKLLDEGRFIRDFPGYMIYIGNKRGNKVKDLVFYEIDEDTGSVVRNLRAGSGVLSVDSEKRELCIDLTDVRMELPGESDPGDVRQFSASKFPIRISFEELLGESNVPKKKWNMTISELIYRIRNMDVIFPQLKPEDLALQRSRLLVHLHQRICLALAPFTFVLVAIPLGIRTHRKESSAGMLLSLAIMFVYYTMTILSDTLRDHPSLHPWLLPWVSIIGLQIAGVVLIRKAD